MKKCSKVGLIFVLALWGLGQIGMAQDREVIQFSGLVLAEDSTSGIPGVHVYVPKTGRGSTTNMYGYFSIPLLVGDSVLFSCVGYEKKYFKVDEDQAEDLTLVIQMKLDTTYLPPIDILPYPSEEAFKKAILAFQLPDQEQYDILRKNLGDEVMQEILENSTMSANMNHRYFMDQQFYSTHYQNSFMPNPLLNPFAWAEFIKSVKKGDLKKKK